MCCVYKNVNKHIEKGRNGKKCASKAPGRLTIKLNRYSHRVLAWLLLLLLLLLLFVLLYSVFGCSSSNLFRWSQSRMQVPLITRYLNAWINSIHLGVLLLFGLPNSLAFSLCPPSGFWCVCNCMCHALLCLAIYCMRMHKRQTNGAEFMYVC